MQFRATASPLMSISFGAGLLFTITLIPQTLQSDTFAQLCKLVNLVILCPLNLHDSNADNLKCSNVVISISSTIVIDTPELQAGAYLSQLCCCIV